MIVDGWPASPPETMPPSIGLTDVGERTLEKWRLLEQQRVVFQRDRRGRSLEGFAQQHGGVVLDEDMIRATDGQRAVRARQGNRLRDRGTIGDGEVFVTHGIARRQAVSGNMKRIGRIIHVRRGIELGIGHALVRSAPGPHQDPAVALQRRVRTHHRLDVC
jgi:hypothetical protein